MLRRGGTRVGVRRVGRVAGSLPAAVAAVAAGSRSADGARALGVGARCCSGRRRRAGRGSSWRCPRISSQSRHSVRAVRTKRSACALACGERNGVWITVDAFGAEDLVKGGGAGGELRVAVADQEPRVVERAGEAEVARLLGDPPAVRVGGRAGDVDAAGLKLDEEQNVVAAEQRGLDAEEVTRHELAACARRNSRQEGPERLGAGRRPARASSRRTVLGETDRPSR